MSDELTDVSYDYVFLIFFRESMTVLSFMFVGYMRQILGGGPFWHEHKCLVKCLTDGSCKKQFFKGIHTKKGHFCS